MPDVPEDIIDLITKETGRHPGPLIRTFEVSWQQKKRDAAVRTANRFFEVYHEALRPHLADLRRGELVDLVTHFRNAGKEDERILIDMWLMARFPPQHIIGVLRPGG